MGVPPTAGSPPGIPPAPPLPAPPSVRRYRVYRYILYPSLVPDWILRSGFPGLPRHRLRTCFSLTQPTHLHATVWTAAPLSRPPAAPPNPPCPDPQVSRLALLSLFAVFKDILPGYRVRPPTDKEMDIKARTGGARGGCWEAPWLRSGTGQQCFVRQAPCDPGCGPYGGRWQMPQNRSSGCVLRPSRIQAFILSSRP